MKLKKKIKEIIKILKKEKNVKEIEKTQDKLIILLEDKLSMREVDIQLELLENQIEILLTEEEKEKIMIINYETKLELVYN